MTIVMLSLLAVAGVAGCALAFAARCLGAFEFR